MRVMPAVLMFATLSGCGLKGDLYLPAPKEAPPASPAPAGQGDDDEAPLPGTRPEPASP